VADAATTQLTQAMTGFGGVSGAAERQLESSDSLSNVALRADTSQQPLLTRPQHALASGDPSEQYLSSVLE
jgi:hypothetical protein